MIRSPNYPLSSILDLVSHRWCLPLFFLPVLLFFPAWVTGEPSVKIEEGPAGLHQGLSRAEIERFNDSFDRFREDLWETASFVPRAELHDDFKHGEVRVEGGRLRAETRTGCFSQAGVSSRFILGGDFDVQVDCDVEFLKGAGTMYQQVAVGLLDRTKELQDDTVDAFVAVLNARAQRSGLVAGYYEKGKWQRLFATRVESFRGSLRFTRTGMDFALFYRKQEESEWTKMASMPRNVNDQIFSLRVRNFVPEMKAIDAKRIFSAHFDNFRINTADRVLEEEI